MTKERSWSSFARPRRPLLIHLLINPLLGARGINPPKKQGPGTERPRESAGGTILWRLRQQIGHPRVAFLMDMIFYSKKCLFFTIENHVCF
ncbi:MAG: hypothetical protein [Microviridae sp.]|nr:MAG: hypothetical protein [Microviridae sp.]